MRIDEFLKDRKERMKKIERYLNDRGYVDDDLVMFYFINDRLKIDPEGWLFKKDLYDAYLEYCRSQQIPSAISDVFFKGLRLQLRRELRDYRPRIGPRKEGKRPRAIKGISLSQAPTNTN